MTASATRPLNAFDAQFLAGEAGNMLSHYCALWWAGPDAAGRPLTRERVLGLVAQRIDRVPALRWRLQSVPLGLDRPRFVDGSVDLDEHVLGLTLPAPGEQAELDDAVGAIMASRLDRRRPLWAFHVIDGLADGRVAIVMQFHHAAADALSAAFVMALLLDVDPESRLDLPASVPVLAPTDSVLRSALGRIPRQPVDVLRAGAKALPHLDQVPMMRTLPGARLAAGVARRLQRTLGRGGEPTEFLHAPRMRFNAPLSPRRAIGHASVPVELVREIRQTHGVTFNDVVVAGVAGGLRRQLATENAIPTTPLLAFVPANVRTVASADRVENAISSLVVPVPTHLSDPVQRILAAQQAMNVAKARHATTPTSLLEDANAMVFPVAFGPLASGILRLMGTGLVDPPLNLTLSNVPGPPELLHLDGAPLQAVAPLSLVFDGVALNVTVVSYAGRLEIGVVGDGDAVPDARAIAEAITEELHALNPDHTP